MLFSWKKIEVRVSIEGIFLISLPYLDFEGNKKIDTHFSSLTSQFLKQYRYTGRR